MEKNSILEVKGVYFNYDKQTILDRINLNVNAGDFLAILGPNGSGKTTLLKIMLGLLKPQSGEVRLFNRNIREVKRFTEVGYVPQKATQFDHRFPATVEEIISSSILARRGLFRGLLYSQKEKIQQALKIVGLEGKEKSLLNALSGGQQQKVFIARALCNNPKLLIMDEPTIGLDCQSQSDFYDFLFDLNKQFNMTLIIVTHDIGVICSKVTKVACLNRQLLFHGQPSEFINSDISKIFGHNLVPFIHHG